MMRPCGAAAAVTLLAMSAVSSSIIARGSSIAPGDDRLEAAHGRLVAVARAPLADTSRERAQRALAPAMARRRIAAVRLASSSQSSPSSVASALTSGDRRPARIVGEQIEGDLERFGRTSFDQRARVMLRFRVLDGEALALEVGERDPLFRRARASRSRWRSRRDRRRSRRSRRARAARLSRRAARAFRARSARARRGRRVVSIRSAARPASCAEGLGLRLARWAERGLRGPACCRPARLRPPPTDRAAAARASARSRARRRPAARRGTASRPTASATMRAKSSVAGPSRTSRFSARMSSGIRRSSSTSSARWASTLIGPLDDDEAVDLRRLVEEVVKFHALTRIRARVSRSAIESSYGGRARRTR